MYKVINLIWNIEVFRGTREEYFDYIRDLVGDSMAALLLDVRPEGGEL